MTNEEVATWLARGEKQLRDVYIEVIKYMRQNHQIEDLEKALMAGRIEEATQLITLAANRFANSWAGLWLDAATRAMFEIDEKRDTLAIFSGTSERAVKQLEESKFQIVSTFTNEQRDVIRMAVQSGLGKGSNSRVIAEDIKGSIGLTPHQYRIVENYRRQLEEGDYAGAQARELVDGRFRPSAAKPPDKQQIDRMVDVYRNNWIAHRAENIAQHETQRALHEGQDEAFQQAVEAGDVESEELEQTWHHAGRKAQMKHHRPGHLQMDGQTVPWNQPFVTPGGIQIRYPHDPQAPLKETMGCRCTITRTIK